MTDTKKFYRVEHGALRSQVQPVEVHGPFPAKDIPYPWPFEECFVAEKESLHATPNVSMFADLDAVEQAYGSTPLEAAAKELVNLVRDAEELFDAIENMRHKLDTFSTVARHIENTLRLLRETGKTPDTEVEE